MSPQQVHSNEDFNRPVFEPLIDIERGASPFVDIEWPNHRSSKANVIDYCGRIAVDVRHQGSFERLRTVHSYGVPCYVPHTQAAESACLVVEQALRDRFLERHAGKVNFVDAGGHSHTVKLRSTRILNTRSATRGRRLINVFPVRSR